MRRSLIEPLINGDHPVEEIYHMMYGLLLDNSFFDVCYGCPAINLIDEMSAVNQDFREAPLELMEEWKKADETNKHLQKFKVIALFHL